MNSNTKKIIAKSPWIKYCLSIGESKLLLQDYFENGDDTLDVDFTNSFSSCLKFHYLDDIYRLAKKVNNSLCDRVCIKVFIQLGFSSIYENIGYFNKTGNFQLAKLLPFNESNPLENALVEILKSEHLKLNKILSNEVVKNG